MRIVSLDLETGGLNPLRHPIIEAAMVYNNGKAESTNQVEHFSLPFAPSLADKRALEINRYEERQEFLDEIQIPLMDGIELFRETLNGALVIGNNVQFDLRFVEHFILDAPWYYAPLDLKAWVAGRCGMDHPASTATIADVSGVPLPRDQHTALADAAWNMGVYRALS